MSMKECVKPNCIHRSVFKGTTLCGGFDGVPVSSYIAHGKCVREMSAYERKKTKNAFYGDSRAYREVYSKHYDEDGKYRG